MDRMDSLKISTFNSQCLLISLKKSLPFSSSPTILSVFSKLCQVARPDNPVLRKRMEEPYNPILF